jgi:hypothetical protein
MFTTAGRTATIAMPPLRRILKYTPAVVMGLLVVAWAFTSMRYFSFVFPLPSPRGSIELGFTEGTIWACHYRGVSITPDLSVEPYPRPLSSNPWKTMLGDFYLHPNNRRLYLPIAFVITAILPLAVGPFIAFRFRLWHYLAYTALVALELAYYLRWQG